jgi:hypothetical protein
MELTLLPNKWPNHWDYQLEEWEENIPQLEKTEQLMSHHPLDSVFLKLKSLPHFIKESNYLKLKKTNWRNDIIKI